MSWLKLAEMTKVLMGHTGQFNLILSTLHDMNVRDMEHRRLVMSEIDKLNASVTALTAASTAILNELNTLKGTPAGTSDADLAATQANIDAVTASLVAAEPAAAIAVSNVPTPTPIVPAPAPDPVTSTTTDTSATTIDPATGAAV